MRKMGIATRCVLIIAGAVLLAASLSCSGAKKEAFGPPPFNQDSTLLAQPVDVPELGLRFSPPLGWNPADTAQLAAFRRMQAGSELFDKFYPVDCLTLYIDSANGAIAYIAEVKDAGVSMPKVAERYSDFLKKNLPPSSLIEAHYRINGLDVYYFLHHTDRIINYKLLGETRAGGKYLIEYVSSGEAFPALEGAMTSSIASLQNASEVETQPVQ